MDVNPGWAVVLGVSSGTGAAIARVLAEGGWHIFGMHRGNYQPQAEALQTEIEAYGVRCHLRVGDAARAEDVEGHVAELRRLAGRGVGCFVHSIANASFGRFILPDGRPGFHPKQVTRSFEAMAHSFVYWAQQMVVHDVLSPAGARLFGLTNSIPENIAHGFGMICASKAALELYIRFLALELGPLGHRVNLLDFGLVETPAIRRAFDDKRWAEVTGDIAAVTPAGRLQSCDEVARFLRLLLHPDAAYLNGARVDFSGGQTQSLLNPIFNRAPKA